MRARVSPAMHPKVCWMPFLLQLSLFPCLGTSLEYARLHTLKLGSKVEQKIPTLRTTKDSFRQSTAVIKTAVMMKQRLWQCHHYESSSGLFHAHSTSTKWRPTYLKTKSTDLGCNSTHMLLSSTPTSAIYYYYSACER